MTEFERITKSGKTLSEFLSSLPILEGPWDKAFHKTFCKNCPSENCDENCPHEDKRNNPEWWLSLEAERK